MPAFTPQFLAFLGTLVGVALYVALLVWAIRRRSDQELAAWLIVVYLAAAMLLQGVEALWRGDVIPRMGVSDFVAVQTFGAFFLSFLLILIVRAFLRLEGWLWLWVGASWALILAILTLDVLPLPEVIWTNGRVMLPREGLTLGWSLLGWLIFMAGTIVHFLTAQHYLRQPSHRNRISYWIPIAILISVNDLLLFAYLPVVGAPLRLAGAALIAYVTLNHHLPDSRLLLRRILIYVVTTSLIVIFYLISTLGVQPLFRALPNYNPLITGAMTAILLAMLFTPMLGVVQRVVDDLLDIQITDAGRMLRQYSESISNILDVQRLANVAMGLILEEMELRRGFLFLVDTETMPDGRRAYRLRAVRSEQERSIPPLVLAEDHPIAVHLAREQKLLLQFDLDLLPKFQEVGFQERQWFSRLDAEVYAPIFANRRWIGLLALGAKLSGQRFSEDDLVTVAALANQTAVALENARLVDHLVKLNQRLTQAYRDLDKANRDLEQLDRTKSDFISIASHELRTPLTVMRGYIEMLSEHPSLDESLKPMIAALHKSTLRLHEIMDSMFDLAQIDARALQLYLQPVDTALLVRNACLDLRKLLADRQLALIVDIPALPLIRADPNILYKVFLHLVNNAIKFTPNGGRIEITGRLVPPNRNDLPDGGVEIVVNDTGVGVDPDFRDLIFTKFYQPGDLDRHSTSKSRFKGGGIGLGLALSKGIVEAHGGRIWVESEGYDEERLPGSQFHVLLPLSRQGDGKTQPMGSAVRWEFGVVQPKQT